MDNGIFWNGSIDEKNQQQHYQSSNAQYHFGSYVQIEEQNFIFSYFLKQPDMLQKCRQTLKKSRSCRIEGNFFSIYALGTT